MKNKRLCIIFGEQRITENDNYFFRMCENSKEIQFVTYDCADIASNQSCSYLHQVSPTVSYNQFLILWKLIPLAELIDQKTKEKRPVRQPEDNLFLRNSGWCISTVGCLSSVRWNSLLQVDDYVHGLDQTAKVWHYFGEALPKIKISVPPNLVAWLLCCIENK